MFTLILALNLSRSFLYLLVKSTVMGRRSYSVNIRLSDNISSVQEKVQKTTGIYPDQHGLQFGNKILQDHLTVFDYNTQNGSILYYRNCI